ncbi:MAG: hypothetical protein C4562_00755 [Actinobacteria bacterium]|nr:MAG: hypothetical protein C4562_00755 [Actinomycetota bacterium]
MKKTIAIFLVVTLFLAVLAPLTNAYAKNRIYGYVYVGGKRTNGFTVNFYKKRPPRFVGSTITKTRYRVRGYFQSRVLANGGYVVRVPYKTSRGISAKVASAKIPCTKPILIYLPRGARPIR